MRRTPFVFYPVTSLPFVPSLDVCQNLTGCGDNEPSPSLPRIPLHQQSAPITALQGLTGFPSLSVKPEPTSQIAEGVLSHETRVFAKNPCKKALAQQTQCNPFNGQPKYWTRFYKSCTEYLRKMNVDEQNEGDNVLVETLRMHMDEGTKMQWSAREECGERLTYQNLIAELQLRHWLRSEAHNKQE